MSFPRYPTYKPSGVEWLGEVPEHWRTIPLKHVAEFINGAAFKPEEWSESGIPIIRIQNLNGSEDFNYFDGGVDDRYLVRDEDLLFGWSGNRGTSFGPFIWHRTEVCALNQHIFRVVPRDIEKRELYWILKAVTAHVEDRAHGIIGMVHITKSDLGAISVPIPEESEQAKIASFLDRETAKIDALIAEQQRLIELLQEKRQAVISHAVTKGLNPNAPMKDSGVEWLGEVPEHWAVCAVGYRYEVRLGKMLDEKRVTGHHLGPYLRNTDVQWGSVNTEELPEMGFDPSEHERYSLKEGDLLVCEGGEVGRSAIWQSSLPVCFYQKALHRLRPLNASQDSPRFQLYIMRMACSKGVFEASSGKATINHLPAEAFRRYRFAYPPLSEQHAISEHLSTVCGEIRRLQQEASSLVSILQERRSALISAAVTGQIDVRRLVEAGADER